MDVNKRLAELLGIEPRCYTQSTLTGHCQVHTLYPLSYLEANNLEPYGDIKYIDFQSPENFVKLLNIMYSECQCMESVCDFFDTFGIEIVESTGSFQGDYLFLLCYSFTQFCPIFQDRFKTQAQQVNWKW